jgi:hypothetical protein
LSGTSTHHQQRKQLYPQHLVFVRPLLLLAAIPDAVDTIVCAPDDGLRYHPKHVEQFLDINKLCKYTSRWIYIRIIITMHGPMNVKLSQFINFLTNIQISSHFSMRKGIYFLSRHHNFILALNTGRWKGSK